MADFPIPGARTPLFVHSFTQESAICDQWGSAIASLTWVANLGVFVPFSLSTHYPVARLYWVNGSTAGGNVDVGIYTLDGAKVTSAGSTAQSGTSNVQYVSVSGLLLAPGSYYWGIVASGTTAALQGSAQTASRCRLGGLIQQAIGSSTLPASITPAVAANALYPIVGMTRTPSGF